MPPADRAIKLPLHRQSCAQVAQGHVPNPAIQQVLSVSPNLIFAPHNRGTSSPSSALLGLIQLRNGRRPWFSAVRSTCWRRSPLLPSWERSCSACSESEQEIENKRAGEGHLPGAFLLRSPRFLSPLRRGRPAGGEFRPLPGSGRRSPSGGRAPARATR